MTQLTSDDLLEREGLTETETGVWEEALDTEAAAVVPGPHSPAFEPVANGGFRLRCGESEIVLNEKGITLKSGAAQIQLNTEGVIEILAAAEVRMMGGKVAATGMKGVKVESAGDLELSTGSDLKQSGVNIHTEAKQLHATRGVIVRSDAEGINEMTGPLIKMNS